MIGSLGATELLIILAIIALLFGASRLTDLGSSLGKGIREFRSEVRKSDEDEDSETDSEESTPVKASAETPDDSSSEESS
jgi:sec-independent protein translocase protein TatA